MIRYLLSFFLFFLFFYTHSQTISGKLSGLKNQSIKLDCFVGLKTINISNTIIDENGNFKLTYSKVDYGVGYLVSAEEKPFFVVLSGEDIELVGELLNLPETIKIIKGKENKLFEKYAKEHPKRELALNAWDYLEKFYTRDSLFSIHRTPSEHIQNEKKRLKNEDDSFLKTLPNDSYVSWFLPMRKLVSSVSIIAQYRPEEIPETIDELRNLDYTDIKLYKSGLFKDAIESHFWLLENSGKPLLDVQEEMKTSIDTMLPKLIKNEKIFNEVSDYLFDLLERHSLFEASEYLALKVLNDVSCTIDNNLARQLETYRVMKKGNIAPDMIFEKNNFANQTISINKLSEIKSTYTIVFFGASWCPKCKEELPEMEKLYLKWKNKGIEVVYIALEDNKNEFIDFSKSFPFPSYSDLKKWDSKIVTDYYIFSTPTIFLLDEKREILLRPNSLKQMDAWVDWYLK
jgi:thiol-disulfide isomerase/thioredoxin